MKIKVKDMDISTGGTFVCLINERDATKFDFHVLDRIKIKRGVESVIAVVDIAESSKAVPPGNIGLFEEVLDAIGARNGSTVEIDIANKPISISYIKKKLKGERLNNDEINEIVKDVVNRNLDNVEMTYFVAASYLHGLNDIESVSLTKAIVRNGNTLKLKNKIIVDKHCSGGVPGNRTTMLVVPIVAAAGYTMPKTSSRAITSPAGTADTMEVLAKVSFSAKQMRKIVRKTNACIVWGGAVNLAGADDKLIQIRNPLALDPRGMLLASILAKKAAVGSTHVVIDIPVGKDTKIKTHKKAVALKNDFIKIGKKLGMKVKVYMTEGYQPIGNGIGPALEARDVLWVLRNHPKAPEDLRRKAIHLAGDVFRMLDIKNPEKKAREILESGKAYKKMKEIIKAQKGKSNIKPSQIEIGKHSFHYKAKKSGKIYDLNNYHIAKVCRIAGAPKDNGAGMYLYKHEKDKVKKGERIFTIYAENKTRLKYAKQALKRLKDIVVIK